VERTVLGRCVCRPPHFESAGVESDVSLCYELTVITL
jgi:hypothetical protein